MLSHGEGDGGNRPSEGAEDGGSGKACPRRGPGGCDLNGRKGAVV